MNKIKTIICDDEKNLCSGYKLYLDTISSVIECVAITFDSDSCMRDVQQYRPDLLLLDIQLENERSGIDLITRIKSVSPETKIIMLTSHSDDEFLFQSIINGANGYVLKQINCAKMFDEILEKYNNLELTDIDLSPEQLSTFQRESRSLYDSKKSLMYIMNNMIKLTVSEYDILHDIYDGYTYKIIAQKRVVEECTIKSTASRIKKKLGFSTMKELISFLKEVQFFDQYR